LKWAQKSYEARIQNKALSPSLSKVSPNNSFLSTSSSLSPLSQEAKMDPTPNTDLAPISPIQSTLQKLKNLQEFHMHFSPHFVLNYMRLSIYLFPPVLAASLSIPILVCLLPDYLICMVILNMFLCLGIIIFGPFASYLVCSKIIMELSSHAKSLKQSLSPYKITKDNSILNVNITNNSTKNLSNNLYDNLSKNLSNNSAKNLSNNPKNMSNSTNNLANNANISNSSIKNTPPFDTHTSSHLSSIPTNIVLINGNNNPHIGSNIDSHITIDSPYIEPINTNIDTNIGPNDESIIQVMGENSDNFNTNTSTTLTNNPSHSINNSNNLTNNSNHSVNINLHHVEKAQLIGEEGENPTDVGREKETERSTNLTLIHMNNIELDSHSDHTSFTNIANSSNGSHGSNNPNHSNNLSNNSNKMSNNSNNSPYNVTENRDLPLTISSSPSTHLTTTSSHDKFNDLDIWKQKLNKFRISLYLVSLTMFVGTLFIFINWADWHLSYAVLVLISSSYVSHTISVSQIKENLWKLNELEQ
jgi:hypothetical protein